MCTCILLGIIHDALESTRHCTLLIWRMHGSYGMVTSCKDSMFVVCIQNYISLINGFKFVFVSIYELIVFGCSIIWNRHVANRSLSHVMRMRLRMGHGRIKRFWVISRYIDIGWSIEVNSVRSISHHVHWVHPWWNQWIAKGIHVTRIAKR